MYYLKLFETHEYYDDFVSDGTMLRPNLSHCIQENEVHYNQVIDPRSIIKYNVTDASEPTKLFNYNLAREITAALLFDKVVIDGTEVSISDLDAASGKTQLSIGEHTVEYTLKDPTAIGDRIFQACTTITEVILPDSVMFIGRYSFEKCLNLASINIPSSLVGIDYGAFGPPENPLYENETLSGLILSFNVNAFKWEK